MSLPHDGQRPFFQFGNPFRMIFPKESYLSPRLSALLKSFEQSLAERLKKLIPKDKSDVLSLSWMRVAMESLCGTHRDVQTLITELQFPVSDWDEKWMDVYLDNSVRLLDICNAFSSEISRLNQGQLVLQCVKHTLSDADVPSSSERIIQARTSLDDWVKQICSRSPKLESCSSILHGLTSSLYMSKVMNSDKGKVLMRAMYGVKVETIFVCSIFAAAFSSSTKTLTGLQVSDKFLWAGAFNELKLEINGEIKKLFEHGTSSIFKELELVESSVKKLFPLISDGVVPAEGTLVKSASDLGESAERFSEGLDFLSKEVEDFFQIVLTGRDALLCNLRAYGLNPDPKQKSSVPEQLVR